MWSSGLISYFNLQTLVKWRFFGVEDHQMTSSLPFHILYLSPTSPQDNVIGTLYAQQFVSTDKPTVFDWINRGLHRSELTNSVSLSVPTTDKFCQFVRQLFKRTVDSVQTDSWQIPSVCQCRQLTNSVSLSVPTTDKFVSLSVPTNRQFLT